MYAKEETMKHINVKCAVENPRYVPVFVSDNRIFIIDTGSPETHGFISLSPVMQSTLEDCRSEYYIKGQCRKMWTLDVIAGKVDCSLAEYMEDCEDIERMNEDKEYFMSKTSVGLEVFDEYPDLRKSVEDLLEEDFEKPVGTWEYNGIYLINPPVQAVISTSR